MRSSLYLVFLWSFLSTLVIEGIVILVIFRRKKYAYYSMLCNLLTNPAMNLLLAASVKLFGVNAYYITLVFAELAVVLVEASVYNYICRFGMRKSVLLSAFLNLLSCMAGLLVNYVVLNSCT